MSNTGDKMLLYLAENINGFLSVNNCTEAEAARGAGLNLTTMNNWICKKAYPRWKNLIKLADYFGCPIYELIEDPERRYKSQRFLTQWQRSLLAVDQESPEIHNLFMEVCKIGNEQDEETLIRLLEYIRALNQNKE
jgi:transcriptional regulator with XRE-family HTH domain